MTQRVDISGGGNNWFLCSFLFHLTDPSRCSGIVVFIQLRLLLLTITVMMGAIILFIAIKLIIISRINIVIGNIILLRSPVASCCWDLHLHFCLRMSGVVILFAASYISRIVIIILCLSHGVHLSHCSLIRQGFIFNRGSIIFFTNVDVFDIDTTNTFQFRPCTCGCGPDTG